VHSSSGARPYDLRMATRAARRFICAQLAIRIREKITQARKISRVVMTADARAVWKDAYESLSQAKPGLLARFLTG
jgi:hypothetical protein